MKKLLIPCIAVLFLLPGELFAWGQSGHYIAGEIAQNKLTKKANKKVTALLGNSSVAIASTWGDFVRSDERFKGREVWHYSNLDTALTHDQFLADALRQDRGELIYRVGQLYNHLKANPNDTVALKFFIHIVEDLHCPMHLGQPVDKGGNTITIYWFGQKTNLHSLWDDKLIDTQKLSYSEYANHLLRTQKFETISPDSTDVVNWAWDTYQFTNLIYRNADAVKKHYNYIFDYKWIAEEQLAKAGNRLAAMLNEIYK